MGSAGAEQVWRAVEETVAGGASPPRVLHDVPAAILLRVTEIASVVFARVEREDVARLAYANADQPPPLLRTPDGAPGVLDGARSVLVGGGRPGHRIEPEATPAPGSVLLLHTDGLVERRDEPLDAGLRRPAGAVRTLATDDPDALCDGVLAALGADRHDDDVAVPAVAVERA